MKYIIVTGGVISGVGKGTIGSSIGYLLKSNDLNVTYIKIDPYLNVDAGTINPYEHGEVFVLSDGTEVDLDLGCYERFLGISLTKHHNITTGKVYKDVIEKERRGDYLGQTVQIVPHITNEIQEKIEYAANLNVGDSDFCIIELGGTVNDMETQPFVEAIRQFTSKRDHIFVHVAYIPFIASTQEHKTKPAQESIRSLKSAGIFPNIIVCRSQNDLNKQTIKKLSYASQIDIDSIFTLPDCNNKFETPDILYNQNILQRLTEKEGLILKSLIFENKRDPCIHVAIVGKYTQNTDSYLSLEKAVQHACNFHKREQFINWIDSENIDWVKLNTADCVIIAPGFGERGLEGKIEIAEWCRRNNKITLGICFGFQAMVIEYARNVCKIPLASSREVSDTIDDVITIIPEINKERKGGTMRLGDEKVKLIRNSQISKIYGKSEIIERHRHRYEVNPGYIEGLEDNGMIFSGKSEDNNMEIFELPTHKFYIGVQYHPEFKTKTVDSHPLFINFIEKNLKRKEGRE